MKKIVVIGAGPGGYVAALKAGILGADVTLIEKERLGGTCLNRGCIPTKSFLMSSKVLAVMKQAEYFGIKCEKAEVDYKAVKNRKDSVVGQLVGGIDFLLKSKNVKLVQGAGKLQADRCVEVLRNDGKSEILQADAVILANGSSPITPPLFQYDGRQVITSDELLELESVPKSIIVVGGGVVGCELAQFYKSMGAQITIVEMAEHILPNEDEDTARILRMAMESAGVEFFEGCGVKAVEKNESSVKAILNDGREISAEKILISIGRKANITDIFSDDVKIQIEKGKITVNNRMQTSESGIYAIGDLTDTPMLAHVAQREAVVAVDNIMGRDTCVSYKAVPRCIYTNPEIGCVGITEYEAKKKGIEYKKGMFRFSGLGKAIVMGETEGYVKVIADKEDRIIGASIVGPEATDLLTEFTMAVHLGINVREMGSIIHAHPTLSEALMEAVHDVHGESVHAF